jgi:hypothetical protein
MIGNFIRLVLWAVIITLAVGIAVTLVVGAFSPDMDNGEVYVFSEERIQIVNRETGETEQKILLLYAINGVSSYAELDDEEELARYYAYLRAVYRKVGR